MTHYSYAIMACLGDSLDYFSVAPFIPTDLSVTGMAAFSFPAACLWMKRGKEREKKREGRDSFTLSSEVEILKMCRTHTRSHRQHTHTHTTRAQGEPRSPFGVPPCVMCFEQQPVRVCGASNILSKGERVF